VRLGVLIVAAAALAACSKNLDPNQYPTPESLLEASMDLYNSGNCNQAIEGFRRLVFELDAFDPRIVTVRYYLAECTLRRGERLEAARLFRRVSDEFPRNQMAPQALLRAGDSYAELWKDPDLDPTYGETAAATYRELLARYPATPQADSANARIGALNEWFAEKGFKNGNFYFRLRAYDSAILYFKDVVANYPQTEHAARSVERLIEAYDKIGYQEEKREMCGYLRQFYPDSQRADKLCSQGASSE
jgi:outer membrane protein assembly factor BamD